jgi:hypothetical protein
MSMATDLGDRVIRRNVRIHIDVDDTFWQEDIARGERDVGILVCCAGYLATGAVVCIGCAAVDTWT